MTTQGVARRRDEAAGDKALISLTEAAALAGKCRSWMYDHRDQLPGLVQIGGRIYARRRVFERWLAGEDVPVAPPRLRAVG